MCGRKRAARYPIKTKHAPKAIVNNPNYGIAFTGGLVLFDPGQYGSLRRFYGDPFYDIDEQGELVGDECTSVISYGVSKFMNLEIEVFEVLV